MTMATFYVDCLNLHHHLLSCDVALLHLLQTVIKIIWSECTLLNKLLTSFQSIILPTDQHVCQCRTSCDNNGHSIYHLGSNKAANKMQQHACRSAPRAMWCNHGNAGVRCSCFGGSFIETKQNRKRQI